MKNDNNCRVKLSPRDTAASMASSARTSFASSQAALERLRIAADDHQQIVEIMSHAAGELSERLHLLRLAELLVGAIERRGSFLLRR